MEKLILIVALVFRVALASHIFEIEFYNADDDYSVEYQRVDESERNDIELSKLLEDDFEKWKRGFFQSSDAKDENSMPTPEMIKKYGYPSEIHKIHTKDGYINTVHRIPPKGKNAPVIFLQHGLLGTSADFVMGSPPKSLGYILSDRGYDVWMGNARGNAYSREHETLTTKDPEYWNFSFDEMGKYDIPAAVDYILNETNSKDLVYIGHSMGTVMFWVAMNQDGNRLKEQVRVMIAMGPVATVQQMKSPIRHLAPFVNKIEYLLSLLGVNEFAPNNRLVEIFDKIACDATMRQLKVCENILFLLVGFDAPQTNLTMLPVILGHEPGGTSTRTVIHFAQEVNTGKFCHFDYGSPELNHKFYNASQPPDYDLAKVTVPVALLWSDNDWLADPEDVKFLIKNLPNIVINYEVQMAKFNHVDFLWGIDADSLVYKQIYSILEKYRN